MKFEWDRKKENINIKKHVAHTFRDNNGKEFVRIISARKATRKEEKAYQERCPR